jgi:dTDP-4-amino-4,6-dideoxygalactose transaminase
LGLAFHPTGWWLATRAGLHRVGNYETSWGYSLSKLSAAQAAVGLALFGSLDEINGRRIANARRLSSCFRELDSLQIPLPAASAEAEPIYLRLPLIVSGAEQRERLFRRLWAAGISAGRMYEQPLSEIFPQLAAERFSGAEFVARHLLTLPTHHYLSSVDVDEIIQICIAQSRQR